MRKIIFGAHDQLINFTLIDPMNDSIWASTYLIFKMAYHKYNKKEMRNTQIWMTVYDGPIAHTKFCMSFNMNWEYQVFRHENRELFTSTNLRLNDDNYAFTSEAAAQFISKAHEEIAVQFKSEVAKKDYRVYGPSQIQALNIRNCIDNDCPVLLHIEMQTPQGVLSNHTLFVYGYDLNNNNNGFLYAYNHNLQKILILDTQILSQNLGPVQLYRETDDSEQKPQVQIVPSGIITARSLLMTAVLY